MLALHNKNKLITSSTDIKNNWHIKHELYKITIKSIPISINDKIIKKCDKIT